MKKSLYVIGSLKNENIPIIGNELREMGFDVFDDWWSPGPEADDFWRTCPKLLNHYLIPYALIDLMFLPRPIGKDRKQQNRNHAGTDQDGGAVSGHQPGRDADLGNDHDEWQPCGRIKGKRQFVCRSQVLLIKQNRCAPDQDQQAQKCDQLNRHQRAGPQCADIEPHPGDDEEEGNQESVTDRIQLLPKHHAAFPFAGKPHHHARRERTEDHVEAELGGQCDEQRLEDDANAHR